MSEQGHDPVRVPEPAAGLARLMAQAQAAGTRGPPPVERWNPPFCGDLDIRIASDGTWFYLGSPIGRPALKRLFASVLKRESDRYFLVTPVEKIGIRVDDAPFLAVEMVIDSAPDGPLVSVRTDVGDVVTLGPGHDLKVVTDATGGLRLYVHVRSGLWAAFSRSLVHECVERSDIEEIAGEDVPVIRSAGLRFALMPVAGERSPA
jgi:hypothetical protein